MIHVKDNWYIDADENAYIAEKRMNTPNKDGEWIYTSKTYHSSIDSAIIRIAEIYKKQAVANLDDETTLFELASVFREINAEFKLMIEKNWKRS